MFQIFHKHHLPYFLQQVPESTHIIARFETGDYAGAINVNSDWAGIEDIHIHTDWTVGGLQGRKILFHNVQNSWARNIETSGYVGFHVRLIGTTHCEIRDSYFHNSEEETITVPGYFISYGVEILGPVSSYNLVENNVLEWFRHAMVIQYLGDDAANMEHNVFGYNFSWNCWTRDQYGEGFSRTTDMEFHFGGVQLTLVEGNVFEQAGFSTSEHHNNTIFRNRINNGGISVGTENNIIGNEFTEIKNPGTTMASFGNLPRGSNISTCIIHGNYVTDIGEPGISWDPSIDDHIIPSSYYLSTKPEWFGNLDWPPYGGDLMPGNTWQNPAEVRFWTEIFP